MWWRPSSVSSVNPLLFFVSAPFALDCSLNEHKDTSLGLIEEEEIGASTQEYANTDDNQSEIDENQWRLHYAQHHHYHRKDRICHHYKPEHLGSCYTHIFLVGPALEHKLLSPEFVILEEPSHPNQLLPRYVLGEPEIDDHKDSYEFVHDQLAENGCENTFED